MDSLAARCKRAYCSFSMAMGMSSGICCIRQCLQNVISSHSCPGILDEVSRIALGLTWYLFHMGETTPPMDLDRGVWPAAQPYQSLVVTAVDWGSEVI